MKIAQEILNILEKCRIENNTLFLPDIQLDRSVYTKVNKCLENIGGKWNRKAKGHVFDYDPTEAFDNLLLTGETEDMKKTFQFFPTPRAVALQMCEMAELTADSYVLEPSIGEGDLADVIWEQGIKELYGVELNKQVKLNNKPYLTLLGADFLEWSEECSKRPPEKKRLFTHAIMNPPFTKQQDIDHIRAAYEMLNPGGILVSVASTSWQWRENKKSLDFVSWLSENDAEIIKLPEGSFKESGTMTPTVIIKIQREGKAESEPTKVAPAEPAAEPNFRNGSTHMIKYIPVDKIIPHPNNPRQDLGDLSELCDSIKARGILQNLTVVPVDIEQYKTKIAGKKAYTKDYITVIGHRRLAAAKLAGLNEVPCTIAEMDENTQIATMLLENMQRSDLTPYEQAQGIQLMLDLGETVATIAEKTGFSQSTVQSRKKLLDLDKEKFKQAEERGGTLMDYAELDKLQDPELKNEVLGHIGSSNFKWKLEQAVEKEKRAAARGKVIEVLETFATRTEDREHFKAQFIGSYQYKDFEIPEDIGDVKYFYCVSGEDLYLLTEATEKDIDISEEEKRKAEEERKEKESGLQAARKRAYKLRMEFAKTVKGNLKGNYTIERMAAEEHVRGMGQMQEKPVADFYEIKGGFKSNYNAKADDKRETLYDFKRRLPDIEAETVALKFLFASVYLKMENDSHSYYHNWTLSHSANSILTRLYSFLCELGYKMSDEEKALQDGTHKLLAKGGED